MNTTDHASARNRWSRILLMVGSIAMLVGALDPLEGSLVILPGSGLLALGTFLGRAERSLLTYRLVVFVLIAIGVGAIWGLSSVGGFGGSSGRSYWWGILILPYLIGWIMGISGPRSPRWQWMLGIVVGLLYLAIAVMILKHSGGNREPMSSWPRIIVGATGLVTIAGCAWRLRRRIPDGA